MVIWIVLASWVIAHALVVHEGAFGVFGMLRVIVGANRHDCVQQQRSGVTNVFCCTECMLVWVTPPVWYLWQHQPDAVQVIGLIGLGWLWARLFALLGLLAARNK